ELVQIVLMLHLKHSRKILKF
ncbi:hypothetical protein A5875_004495, partial [Enterococcus sp. 3H8_DIV0648]